MKNFLAVYLGTEASMGEWNRLDPAEQAKRQEAGMKGWGDWVQAHHDVIVEMGGPLGKTKRISRSGIADVRNALTGYTVVRAESHDAAAKLFEGHPHFTIFPGESVEVMEVLPIPGA